MYVYVHTNVYLFCIHMYAFIYRVYWVILRYTCIEHVLNVRSCDLVYMTMWERCS